MIKKLLAMAVFALTLIPSFFMMGNCYAAAHDKAEDITIRLIALDDKGKDLIRTNMQETEDYFNWVFDLTTDSVDYYDFGEQVHRIDVSVPYGSTMSIATEATHSRYEIPNENPDEAMVIDGGVHYALEMNKANKKKELTLTVMIPNKGDDFGDGKTFNYKYAKFEHIPVSKDKTIILGGIEQFGDESDTDYIIFVTCNKEGDIK